MVYVMNLKADSYIDLVLHKNRFFHACFISKPDYLPTSIAVVLRVSPGNFVLFVINRSHLNTLRTER